MPEVRFHIITCALFGNHGQEQMTALLANCLSRQGFRTETGGGTLTASGPLQADGAPEEVFLVLHELALPYLDLGRSTGGGMALVVASARPARVIQRELALPGAEVATVDAEGIAEEEGADPVVAVLAAAVRAVPCLDPEAMGAAIWSAYDRHCPYTAHSALQAFDAALAQTQCAPGAVMRH